MDDNRKCCDTCQYYEWYYDKCQLYDCEVDARSVCSDYLKYLSGLFKLGKDKENKDDK